MTTENRTSEFHGITPVDGVYRVRAWSPEKWRTIGPDCGSLREALLERNRLWRDADEFTLKKIALRPLLWRNEDNDDQGYAQQEGEDPERFLLCWRDFFHHLLHMPPVFSVSSTLYFHAPSHLQDDATFLVIYKTDTEGCTHVKFLITEKLTLQLLSGVLLMLSNRHANAIACRQITRRQEGERER